MADADVFLEVYDDYYGPGQGAGQGRGRDSIDYFWNEVVDTFAHYGKDGNGGLPSGDNSGNPNGTQYTWSTGMSPEQAFYKVCGDALKDAADRAEALGYPGEISTSRVVGVYFSYQTSGRYWNPSMVTAAEYQGGFGPAWNYEKTDLFFNGNHEDYAASQFHNGMPALPAIADQFNRQIDRLTGIEANARYLTCVALNDHEPQVTFQPTVTTAVESKFVDKGAAVPDRVTFGVEGTTPWIKDVKVRARGTLYGPFREPQPRSANVPAGAPVAGTAVVERSAPGTSTAASNVHVTKSGYYTWVWVIDKDDQPGNSGRLIKNDFRDAFFEVNETSIVPAQPKIDTNVTTPVVSKGAKVYDKVDISGTSTGDLWLKQENGSAVTLPLKYEVFGPYADRMPAGTAITDNPATAADERVPVLTGTHSVTNYGETGPIELGTLNYSGYYTVKWSVDTPRLTAADKLYIDSDYYNATDGTWQPNETITVRMAPQVTTLVKDRIIDETIPAQEVTLFDNVSLTLPEPGKDVWLNEGGKPVPVPVLNQPYGPYDVPETPRPDPTPADAGKKVGDGETVAFTEPGEKQTPGKTKVSNSATGFYTWESKIATDPLHFDGFDSDFWVVAETTSVRDHVEHFSEVIDHEVNQNGNISDQVEIWGMRDNHGRFEGIEGWLADNDNARVVVYGPLDYNPSETDFAEVPEDTPVLATIEGPAENDDKIRIGQRLTPEHPRLGDYAWAYDSVNDWIKTLSSTDEAWYVFVYEFDGDDRTAPYVSPFNDRFEYAHVPGEIAKSPIPSIDVEKSNDEAVDAGRGLYNDRDDNRNELGTDADTKESAVNVAPGAETKLVVRVTNNGYEDLVDIKVEDKTTLGDKKVEFECQIPEVLRPDESFTCEGLLPELAEGEFHGDIVEVTATGMHSKQGVGDDDPWHGVGVGPSIDVEKSNDAPVDAGDGMGKDPADNRNKPSHTDADTKETAVKLAGDEPTSLYVRVTNNGTEDLVDVKVTDKVTLGNQKVEFSCDIPEVFKVGASFVCEAELPVLAAGEWHGDLVTVTGKGTVSGIEVSDNDPWFGVRPSIVEVSGSTLAGHTDTNEDGRLSSGDDMFDKITITGTWPEGSKVEAKATAFAVPFESVMYEQPIVEKANGAPIEKLIDEGWKEVGTYEVEDEVTKPGTYSTESFVLSDEQFEELGALTWVATVTVTAPDGTTATWTGERGDLDETLGPLHYGAKSQGVNKISNAITGPEMLTLLGIAVSLMAAGAVSAVVADRKRKTNLRHTL